MTDFKVGEMVRIKDNNGKRHDNDYSNCYCLYGGMTDSQGKKATIIKIENPIIKLDIPKVYNWNPNCLEKLSSPSVNKSMTKTFSIIAKKLLNKHIKAMIKVGWLDDNLEPTVEGIRMVVSEYILTNTEELGETALKILKKQKQESKDK